MDGRWPSAKRARAKIVVPAVRVVRGPVAQAADSAVRGLAALAVPAAASVVRAQEADSAVRGGTLLSIRHPRLMSVPTRDEARVHGVVSRLIEALRTRTPGPIRLLCHDLRDLEFASSFTDVDYILPDDVHGYLQLLREAALVVSFRLHAFVPCLRDRKSTRLNSSHRT